MVYTMLCGDLTRFSAFQISGKRILKHCVIMIIILGEKQLLGQPGVTWQVHSQWFDEVNKRQMYFIDVLMSELTSFVACN